MELTYKLGLALQAGGVRGFSHIAVLELLEQYRAVPEIIAGSSIGAVVSALYCIYEDSKAVYQILSKNVRAFLNKSIQSYPFAEVRMLFRENLIELDEYYRFFREMFGKRRFSELNRKLLVVSFDLSERRSLVIEEGFIVDAVLASCTVPGFFQPTFLGGSKQLDGGILSPLPVSELREHGAEFVIASAFEAEKTSIQTYEELLAQLDSLREKEIVEFEIGKADYAFVFPVKAEWMEFNKYRSIYEDAKKYLEGRKVDFENFLRGRFNSLLV